MANTTVQGALSIHGTNPQYLVETVIRTRIYESVYWKEHCFALNAASLIDNANSLSHIGGTYANQRPSEFLCLVLKLLQIQPEREIILEYLRAEEFKYLRALAAFYVRLTFDSLNVYEILEPLLDDYRKLRIRGMDGAFALTTMDEFADQLLHEERVCDVQLPRLTQRKVLEEVESLPKRVSKLARAMQLLETDEQEEGYASDASYDSLKEGGMGAASVASYDSLDDQAPPPDTAPDTASVVSYDSLDDVASHASYDSLKGGEDGGKTGGEGHFGDNNEGHAGDVDAVSVASYDSLNDETGAGANAGDAIEADNGVDTTSNASYDSLKDN